MPKQLALALLLLCSALPAFGRDWHIRRFDASIQIDRDGSAEVTEHITFAFVGQWNGIYRTIPIEYPGPGGTNFTLFLTVENVRDGATFEPLKYETKRVGDFRKIKVYIPGAADTTKQVDIIYRVINPVRHFPDYDEFYWNVTGLDWAVPIDVASATVRLPESATGLRAQAYTGSYGSVVQDATVNVRGSSIESATRNALSMHEGLTVDVYIPKGIVAEPGELTLLWAFVRSNLIILLPLLTLVVMSGLWYFIGRDPDPGISVAPQYGPPQDFTPAEVGALADDSVNPRDITCTIVDLAVRGFLRIEEVQEKHFLFSSKDYVFHRVKDRTEWSSLHWFERLMLQKIFGAAAGDSTKLSTLKNEFYTAIPSIKKDIIANLKKKGMYRVDPNSGVGYAVAGAILLGLIVVTVGKVTGTGPLDSGVVSVVAILASAVIVWFFARIMTAKTFAGARAWTHIKGFQEFMDRVEADRLRTLPPDTFEKFLPYAMALGVEDHWANAFAGILQQPPTWYSGPNYTTFNTSSFTRNLGAMTSTAHSTFVSAPRASSSGSGFSSGGGGGFSGGGFGGGGGGAF